MIRVLLWLFTACFMSACAANQSILQDKSGAGPESTPVPAATPVEPVKKFTVGQLMERVANAPPDSFLFPCTLNAYSDDDRSNLKKLRDQWLAREDDAQYLIAPSTGCVCPGVCVLAVEDTRSSPPANSALIVIDHTAPEKYYWLARGLDLSNARLSWINSNPSLEFKTAQSDAAVNCLLEAPATGSRVVAKCSDAKGKRVELSR
jgi:hypothetical protein